MSDRADYKPWRWAGAILGFDEESLRILDQCEANAEATLDQIRYNIIKGVDIGPR